MQSFTYVVQDPMGIHARPAGMLAKAAMAYPCAVTLTAPAGTADAKRLMSIMRLAVKAGMEVTVSCEGEQEEEAAAGLEAFFQENL
ncbi:MAG: HPr family phosphocarrier protein [Oscillospiraceae bacterium]|jgi:phosphocarrier protein HPr|nr:HPr family phosphocarrier protein [Oscillospiraceae bacterium]MCI9264440.1 HPr family phosphocarrier protein [Oscillospiraceae bacterium]